MQFPVTLDVKPSRRLRAALFLAHLLALGALILSGAGYSALFAGSVVLCVSLLRCWRSPAPVRLRLGQDGVLYRIDGARAEERLSLLPGTAVFSWLVVVRARGEGGQTRALVIMADSLPSGGFRALRVWLRWRAKFSASAAPV